MDKIERERKHLNDAVREWAEKRNLKCIDKVIPFENDDLPKYLKRLTIYENKPKKNIMVKSYALAPAYSF
jgi:hypothetical protein